jgi:hypothetical protein
MRGIKNLYKTMMLLWLMFRMCYRMASVAQNSAAFAHKRIDSVITQVGALHSGSLSAGQAVNATNAMNATNLNLGNGNLTSLFTGSESVPASVGTYSASLGSDTLAQLEAFLGTAGSGGVFFNNLCSAIDQLSTTVAYIQSELSAHNFSST